MACAVFTDRYVFRGESIRRSDGVRTKAIDGRGQSMDAIRYHRCVSSDGRFKTDQLGNRLPKVVYGRQYERVSERRIQRPLPLALIRLLSI